MWRYGFVLIGFAVFSVGSAHAACPTTPLANGTTANADDVMAWLNCKAPLDNPVFTGNVAIGAGTPISRLQVTTSSPAMSIPSLGSIDSGTGAYVTNLNPPYGVLIGSLNSGDGWIQVQRTDGTASAYDLLLQPNGGNIGIGNASPAQLLDVSGTIRQAGCTTAGTLSVNTAGDIICTSDARLKSIHGPFQGGLDAISKIRPVLFSYRPTAADPKESFVHAGFVAQNVRAAIPQASALQHDGYYSLDTTAILAAAVNAIKELKTENIELAKKVTALQDISNKQSQELHLLKAKVDGVDARGTVRPLSASVAAPQKAAAIQR